MKRILPICTPKHLSYVALCIALFAIGGCVPVSVTDIQSAMLTATPQAESADMPTESDASLGGAVATVSSAALQLHLGPAETSAVLGEVTEGEEYKVIGISSDGTWVRLEVLDSPRGAGWVPARFVSVLGDITDVPITDETGEASVRPTPAPNGAVVQTDGTRLRVRTAPDTAADILTYVYDGEAFTVLETTPDGTWTRIDAPGFTDGGWVASEFLLLGSDVAPTPSPETAEATPAPATEATTPVAEEATPTAVAEEAEPTVEATSTPVAEESTPEPAEEPTAEPPAEPTTEPVEEATPTPAAETGNADSGELDLSNYPTPGENEAVIVTDGSRLRVRSQPAVESEIVGYVLDGEVYEILAVSDDGEWLQIELETGESGWIVDVFTLTADGLEEQP